MAMQPPPTVAVAPEPSSRKRRIACSVTAAASRHDVKVWSHPLVYVTAASLPAGSPVGWSGAAITNGSCPITAEMHVLRVPAPPPRTLQLWCPQGPHTSPHSPDHKEQHNQCWSLQCAPCCAGSEGFYGQGDPNVAHNPATWAAQTGQNFVDDNKHMDFAVTHAWPDNCE